MRIVQVLPGSGGAFYCENCIRDTALVTALRAAGEEVVMVPMYLPQLEATDVPVFFGGINVYLQQKFGFFRMTPRWLDRLFDSKPLLRMAAKRAASVRASGLGETTLSVLRGADGNQAKELARLMNWMEKEGKPEVVHLSNPLLIAIGTEVKKRLGVPVVCSLQDEDTWIDAMDPPYPERCWEAMSEAARDVDAFVAVSRYFGGVMRERMKIDEERLHVVPVGIDPGGEPPERPHDPPVLGYLARMTGSLGLGILADAFIRLKKSGRFAGLRLHLSGGATADDTPFLEELKQKFATHDVDGDVEFYAEFDDAKRRRFLESLTLLSVPALRGVAFGTYLVEALAAGVPVVQPRLGSFPELMEATGGGVVYEPNDADTLAGAIGDLLEDRGRLSELSRRGRESVVQSFSMKRMAEGMLEVYRRVVP